MTLKRNQKSASWLLALTMLSTLHAAELQPETLSSWDRYIQAADGAMHARLLPGHKFLWIDEAPDRRQQLRQGEILASNYEGSAEKVPSGLIHHWIGAAFFPNTKMDDVLGVVRDYSRYKDYYNPSVIDSHTIQQTADTDRFSMLLMNKAFFLKTALAGEYRSVYAQAGNKRWYGIASSVRMQEVEDYGGAGEHNQLASAFLKRHQLYLAYAQHHSLRRGRRLRLCGDGNRRIKPRHSSRPSLDGQSNRSASGARSYADLPPANDGCCEFCGPNGCRQTAGCGSKRSIGVRPVIIPTLSIDKDSGRFLKPVRCLRIK